MRTRIIISSVLILIAAIIHTVGGELMDIKQLMGSSIPTNIKIEFRAVWYLVSVDFFFSGAYLIIIIIRKSVIENKLLINFIGTRMILYGITFLLLILLLKFNIFQVPQWILLISIGILLRWDNFKRTAQQ